MPKFASSASKKRPRTRRASLHAEIAKLLQDLHGLEQLQAMQVRLIQEMRREVEAIAKTLPSP